MTRTPFPELTRRQCDVIRQLRFRAGGETNPAKQVCWLGRVSPTRSMLIVPTMMGTWGIWERFNNSTFADLADAGWVEIGPEVELPADVAKKDVQFGSSIRLIPSKESS